VGRFQAVGTHPDHRRQGICATLVYETARRALATGRAVTLVMVADPDYHAARIYESVGFAAAEQQVGICWHDRQVRGC
jgi:predicted GNAT family acetyltransferase